MDEISNPQLTLATEFVEKTNRNIFLTGKAGTGKTTFLKSLKQKSFKRMVVVAPTGVAAINAGGVTIHSFFQLTFGPQLPFDAVNGSDRGVKKFNRERINIIRSLDLLVIDEISMVRADVLDAIDLVLRHYRDKSRPFGGVQLLMIGDIHQLAPVVKDDEWELLRNHYTTMYFFGSKALNEVSYVSIELKHIYRQSDRVFIDLLNKIRENNIDNECLELLRQRYNPGFDPPDDKGYIILATHNNSVNNTNANKLAQLKAKSHKFKAIIKDDFPEYLFPTNEELELKVGAQVMFVKNDSKPEKLYFNGKIGIVRSIENDTIYVKCPSDFEEIPVSREEWQNNKYSLNEETKEISETIVGTFTQFPLKLAWAITIHKSQGLTFDHAIIDAQASFAHGQVYVALSRCRTLEGLVMKSMIYEKSIVSDGSVLDYTRQMGQNPPSSGELQQSIVSFHQYLLLELFDFKKILIPFFQSIKHAKENEASLGAELLQSLLNTNKKVKTEISDVSEKFQQQLTRIISQEGNVEGCELVQDRIKKACVYFLGKMNFFSNEVFNLKIDTDNKSVRKSIQDILATIKMECHIKEKCLENCKKGFFAQPFLKVRALAAIDGEQISRSFGKNKPDVKDGGLHQILKEWRDNKAEQFDVPEFHILPKKTMHELVKKLPITTAELKAIHGIGSVKVKEFGAELLELIDTYCKENNIARDETLTIEKPKPDKVNTKQLTFDLYKSGKSIEEISRERNLAVTTIEGHIAYFVSTGEIPINELVDEYKIILITSFYEKMGECTLSEAKAALTDDIEWGELKLVVGHLEYLKNLQN